MSKGSANRTIDRESFHRSHPERRPGRPGSMVYVVRDGEIVEKQNPRRLFVDPVNYTYYDRRMRGGVTK